MRTLLATTCALAALTGFATAQSPTSQPPATATTPSQAGSPQAAAVQRVEGSALVMTFYRANPADTRASKLIGRNVYNLNNENIGEVSDLVIDNGKTIKAIVVSVGGFLGMGERNVAISPASVVMNELADGSSRLVVNTTKESLKAAQAFNFADVDKAGPDAGKTNVTGTIPAKK